MTTAETIVILIIFGVIASVLIGIVLHEFKVIARLKALKTFIISAFKPLTPLQKEIREEERTIKELKRQKADMERLAELKRERDALFEEESDRHVERAEEEQEEVRREYDTGRMYTIRKCPKCKERAMVYYGGFPEYDWLCCYCRHSEFENELESLCISCGKGHFEYKRYKTPGINIYQCTYCCKEIRQKTWKGARG